MSDFQHEVLLCSGKFCNSSHIGRLQSEMPPHTFPLSLPFINFIKREITLHYFLDLLPGVNHFAQPCKFSAQSGPFSTAWLLRCSLCRIKPYLCKFVCVRVCVLKMDMGCVECVNPFSWITEFVCMCVCVLVSSHYMHIG